MADNDKTTGVPESGNLQPEGKGPAAGKPAPTGSGAAAPAPGGDVDKPHGDTMGGAAGSANSPKMTPPPQPAAAKTAGEGKAQPPTTDAGKQGHQAALTQNNQQAVAGGHAESRVGAVDPLQQRSLTEQAEGTRGYKVASANFHFNGQGPYQPGETLYLTEEEHKRARTHLEEPAKK